MKLIRILGKLTQILLMNLIVIHLQFQQLNFYFLRLRIRIRN